MIRHVVPLVSLLLVATLPLACGGSSADSAAGGAGSAGAAGSGGSSGAAGSAQGGSGGSAATGGAAGTTNVPFPIVDTGQQSCFNGAACEACPAEGQSYFGQDSQYVTNAPAYQNNGDGTVTDLVTGLMWQKDPGDKMTYEQAVTNVATFNLGGYTDWRLPTIKEMYSLISFRGRDISGCQSEADCDMIPFIDSSVFDFEYGDTNAGERLIDSQYLTSTLYESTTMNGDETLFGVNFADGRIKGYPLMMQGSGKLFFVTYVRGNPDYGINDFEDHGDGTITDHATGLMWMQTDSGDAGIGDGGAVQWQEALSWCEGLEHAGYGDWRLPDVKELQSIVDYTRCPETTGSAAIDPLFSVTAITDEGSETNYPFYWSSTTHATTATASVAGASASYVAFGEALGWMQAPGGGDYALLDVHGAGAQRSDPKTGNPADYPYGHGPQGDVIRIYNHVRCVRSGSVSFDSGPGDACAASGTGGSGGTSGAAGAGGSGGGTPSTCSEETDCQAAGMCPPDAALGCTCLPDAQGTKVCIPKCVDSSDCPSPPGMTLTCDPSGICVPA